MNKYLKKYFSLQLHTVFNVYVHTLFAVILKVKRYCEIKILTLYTLLCSVKNADTRDIQHVILFKPGLTNLLILYNFRAIYTMRDLSLYLNRLTLNHIGANKRSHSTIKKQKISLYSRKCFCEFKNTV